MVGRRTLAAIAVVIAPMWMGAPVTASAPAPDQCATGYALLALGEIARAEQHFQQGLPEQRCVDGLTLATLQRDRAAELAETCATNADALASATSDDDWLELWNDTQRTCDDAVRLDVTLAETVDDARESIPSGPPDADDDRRPDDWWDDWWSGAQDIAVIAAQIALALAIALPVLNAIGAAVAQLGPASARRNLGKRAGRRLVTIVALGVTSVIGMSETGGSSTWAWTCGALLVATAALWAASDHLGFLIGAMFLTVLTGASTALVDDGHSWANIVVTLGSFVLLAWVLAQHRRVRFETFTGGDSAAVLAPLIATELINLADPRDSNLSIVDPFSAADLDGDSVSVLGGPENKVAAAAIKVFRALFQTGTDWYVSGQAVTSTTDGDAIALQLKYGRRTSAATTIRASGLTSAVKTADGKDAPAIGHTDLAHAAAAWVLIELMLRFEGDDLSSVTSLDGATVPRALALHAAATRAQARGNASRALDLYARAIETDPNYVPARLGFAMLASDVAADEERETLTTHLVEVTEQILHAEAANRPATTVAATSTAMMARHARVVALLNLIAANAEDDGTASDDDRPKLDMVKRDLEQLAAELDADAAADITRPMRLAFESSLASLRPFVTGVFDDERWLATVRSSPRSAYNAACISAAPLLAPAKPEQALELLAIAVAHPRYKRLAATEPFLRELREREPFRRLIGTPSTNEQALAGIDAIGKAYAAKLAAGGIDDLTGIAAADVATLVATSGAPLPLVRLWKDLAGLDAIDGIGPTYTNLLFRCGVRSRHHLARSDAAQLTELARGIAAAGATTEPPGRTRIAGWIADARQPAP